MTTNRQLTDAALEASLARYAGRVSANGLQAGIMADVAATEQAHRPLFVLPGWLDRPVAPGRLAAIPTVAWVLLLTGLLLGLVVGGLAAGAFRRDVAVVTPIATPTLARAEIEVLPPGPVEYTRMVATSGDELWAISGGVVWHFRDGGWTSAEMDAGHVVGPHDRMTLAPDGTVWAAGDGGVAYWSSGRWVIVDAHAASAVEVDREGTVWVAGTESSCDIWSLRPSGSGWTRKSAECPFSFGGGVVHAMAVDGRGALWVGAGGFVRNALARYAEGRWEATEARAGLPDDLTVTVRGVTANGDVWIGFQRASGGHATARFDGMVWTVISQTETADRTVAVAHDGAMWASAIGRYDWKGLEGANPSVVPPLTPLVVAPDGTVFAVDGDQNLVRLVAASP
jgi:hypothetical protein